MRQREAYLWVSSHLIIINKLIWIKGLKCLDLKKGSER